MHREPQPSYLQGLAKRLPIKLDHCSDEEKNTGIEDRRLIREQAAHQRAGGQNSPLTNHRGVGDHETPSAGHAS